jgi:hypothetical protein
MRWKLEEAILLADGYRTWMTRAEGFHKMCTLYRVYTCNAYSHRVYMQWTR